jgi:polysaccharide biosynthesis protein PslJ
VAATRVERRRTAPLWLVGVGAATFAASIPFGPKAAAAGSGLFLVAALAAARDARRPLASWATALALLVWLIWLVPIKLYRLPVNLGFSLEPYRVFLMLLAIGLLVWLRARRGTISAVGMRWQLLALTGAALATQIVNFSALREQEGTNAALKSLSYFLSYLLVFLIVASVTRSLDQADAVLRALVLGGALVAVFALYESRTDYNFFDHLNRFVPGLVPEPREVFLVRGGLLRVHASAQHPIALGVVLAMVVPIALYLSTRASSVLRSRLWLVAGGIAGAGAVVTISRTTVIMFVAMPIMAIALRGRAITKYWPVLLVLPILMHAAAPGALGSLYKSFFPKGGLVSDAATGGGESGSGRLADIGPGLDLWSKSPLVGKGIGDQLVTPTTPATKSLGQANVELIFDDEYLNTLVVMGLFGLLAIVWFVWGSVIRLSKAAKRIHGPPGDMITACAVSGTGFVVSMFLFDAFSFVQATLVFVILAAAGLRIAELERSRTAGARAP